MILHAAPFMGFLITSVQQAPIVIQCQQSTSDPYWKWPLQGLLQLFTTLIPIAGGVWIALWSFRATRDKDHKCWVLDNKRLEWQKLLNLASAVEVFMPSVAPGGETINAVHDPAFDQHLRSITRASLECVFIPKAYAAAIYESLVKIRMLNEQSKGHIEDYGMNAYEAEKLGKPRPLIAAKNVQSELASLWREIRQFASED